MQYISKYLIIILHSMRSSYKAKSRKNIGLMTHTEQQYVGTRKKLCS